MVTYLKLRVQGVKDLVKLSDKGVSTLLECLHHLAGIFPDICKLGRASRAGFPFYHGTLSWSFSRVVRSGGHGDGGVVGVVVAAVAMVVIVVAAIAAAAVSASACAIAVGGASSEEAIAMRRHGMVVGGVV